MFGGEECIESFVNTDINTVTEMGKRTEKGHRRHLVEIGKSVHGHVEDVITREPERVDVGRGQVNVDRHALFV